MLNKKWIIFILLGLLALGVSACNKSTTQTPPATPAPAPVQQAVAQDVILYFADNQAEYLVPEKRSVQVDKADDVQKLAEAVVKELIVGPKDSHLFRTLPAESRLLSVKIDKNVVIVDFSKELQSKHSGGSTGEIMTVYSLVNSLAELPGINTVQLLIEGQKVDSLVGHVDTSEALTRDATLLKK
ncbi:MAG TPA: GerMN domain-containing protein [Syntrophomonadaceae bacterium]|nr:GerMN domain-containing protein [Syntrophomonadaceae bacterium]